MKHNIDLYEQGKKLYIEKQWSLTKIAKLLHISRGRLSIYLKQQNIKVINRQNTHTIFSNIFQVIDTEEKAYWLGFLYADGYVSSTTNHIELALSIKDYEHIQKFGAFIGYQGSINTNDIRVRLTFQDKKMHQELINKGCVPNKSLILTFPTEDIVPKHLIRHFVRGYVDGDGYIGIHTNNFGRLGITCGSTIFIKELIKVMQWREKTIRKDKRSNAHNVEWAGLYVTDMLEQLYKDANVYLNRKQEKYLQIKNAVLGRRL